MAAAVAEARRLDDGRRLDDAAERPSLPRGELIVATVLGMLAYGLAAAFVDIRARHGAYGPLQDALWVIPFWEDARSLQHGAIPYLDMALEYPPFSLVAFALPGLAPGSVTYEIYRGAFEITMTILGMLTIPAVVATVARLGGRRLDVAIAVAAMVASVPLLGPLLLSRYDVWPALLTALAVVAVVHDRHALGYAMLAVGALAKVYPGFLLPVFLVHTWRRRGPRETVAGLAAVALVALVGLVPFLVVAGGAALDPFTRSVARPLQVESLGATVLILLHDLFGASIGRISLEFGSYNLTAPLPSFVSTIQTLLLASGLLVAWSLFAAGRATNARFAIACAAVIAVSVAFGKVLSPQYVIWLIPAVAVLGARRGLVPLMVLAAVLFLTGLYYPESYAKFLLTFDLQATLTILERNIGLVLLAGLLVASLAPARGEGRSLARGPGPWPERGPKRGPDRAVDVEVESDRGGTAEA